MKMLTCGFSTISTYTRCTRWNWILSRRWSAFCSFRRRIFMPLCRHQVWSFSFDGLVFLLCCYVYIHCESKKLGQFFTAYNFRNIEQIFTKFGTNQSLFILNMVPEFLNQLWKILAPFSEWRLHFYNYKFWIGDHFLTLFQPTSLHCYFTFFIK